MRKSNNNSESMKTIRKLKIIMKIQKQMFTFFTCRVQQIRGSKQTNTNFTVLYTLMPTDEAPEETAWRAYSICTSLPKAKLNETVTAYF